MSLKDKAKGIGTDFQVTRRDNSTPKSAVGQLLVAKTIVGDWEKKLQEEKEKSQAEIQRLENELARAKATEAKDIEAQLLKFKEQTQREFEQKLKELDATHRESGANYVSLDRLHKVEGRQRQLTIEQRAELKANMKALGRLITPLTVELRADGDYDIVSGSNRFDFAKELGWQSVPIFIFSGTHAEAEVSAFYANLLHPSLPDYEKYLNFKRIVQSTGKSQKDLIEESGLSASTVYAIFAFDKLPQSVLNYVQKRPDLFSQKLATKLAALAEDGKEEGVLKACEAFVGNDKLTHADVIKIAEQKRVKSDPATQVKAEISNRTVKKGRAQIAKLRGAQKTLRIEFSSEELRQSIEELVEKLIYDYVNK